FFQALNIATKISRGQIEIVSRVHLIHAGEKVGNSEAALLQRLNVRPFTYGIEVQYVYDDGEIFNASVLDIDEQGIVNRFMNAAKYVAALSRYIGYPTRASLVHTINYAYKAVLSIGLGTDYKFKQAKEFENFLKNPGAFAPAAAAGGAAAPVEEEEEEEEEVEGAGGLFGDDDEDEDW
ncbi:RPP0A, partial [Symbiodinium sp. KB8]